MSNETHDRNAHPICAIIHIRNRSNTHTDTNTDDEEATEALAKAVSRRFGIPTFTSPGYSSGSFGHTERVIQTLWAQLRTLQTQMGRQIFEVADPNDSSYCRLG